MVKKKKVINKSVGLKRKKRAKNTNLTREKDNIKLLKFKIRNYRSCEATTLTPNKGLTALIGVNGAGKSNLLSAILLLKKTMGGSVRLPRHIDTKHTNRSSVNIEINYNGSTIFLRGTIFYSTNNKNIDDFVGSRLKWNLESVTGEKKWIELPVEIFLHGADYPFAMSHAGRLFYSYKQREAKNLMPENVTHIVRNIFRYLKGIKYYSASQFSDPSRCPVQLDLEDGLPKFRRRRDVINHEWFMYDLYKSHNEHTQIFERYKNIIGQDGVGLIDDLQFTEIKLPSNFIDVRAGGEMEKKKQVKLVVVPTFTIDGNTRSPSQLSEGTFKTLALLYYVMTDDSQLLLIEEPEVCIHHGLLSSIISIIKNESKEKQIIISTHSDYVLDQLEPDNVVLLDRNVEKGTTAKPISKSMSKTDFKALKQYLKESGNLGEYWREGGLVDG